MVTWYNLFDLFWNVNTSVKVQYDRAQLSSPFLSDKHSYCLKRFEYVNAKKYTVIHVHRKFSFMAFYFSPITSDTTHFLSHMQPRLCIDLVLLLKFE